MWADPSNIRHHECVNDSFCLFFSVCLCLWLFCLFVAAHLFSACFMFMPFFSVFSANAWSIAPASLSLYLSLCRLRAHERIHIVHCAPDFRHCHMPHMRRSPTGWAIYERKIHSRTQSYKWLLSCSKRRSFISTCKTRHAIRTRSLFMQICRQNTRLWRE